MIKDKAKSPRQTRSSSFWSNESATSAVEFAIVASPFFVLILCGLQIGLYYFTQSALDAGVLATEQTLYNGFRTGATPSLPSASSLKSSVATQSGGLIQNDSNSCRGNSTRHQS